MTVGIPDHFMGKPIPDDAIEIALAAEKKKKDGERENEEKETQGKAQGESPSLADFIYVPSIKLHFAKEISHLGKDWHDAHRELHKQNLRMPTVPQFVEFLKYLRANRTAENIRVYEEITEKRDPWKAEHLDAKFYAKDDELWVLYKHIVDSNGDLLAQGEKLEGHLMQDKTPGISLEYWLNNPTKQGLPPEDCKPGSLGYWHPRDGTVARFIAHKLMAGLDCDEDPKDPHSGLGVRAVRTRTQNAGGKQ